MDEDKVQLTSAAQITIEAEQCTANEADATVTFTIRIFKSAGQSVENVSAKVGSEDATVTEDSSTPTEVVYSGQATVDCDGTYDITAKADLLVEISSSAVPVTCDPCGEC